jgi:anti-anti-sigma regulatory factor
MREPRNPGQGRISNDGGRVDAKPKRLTVAPCPGGVIATFTDRKLLDEASAWGWLRSEFEQLAERDAECVWLDARAVEFVSTSFLGVVVALHRRLQAKGARLVLIPSPGIRDVCHLTKLDTLLQLDPG